MIRLQLHICKKTSRFRQKKLGKCLTEINNNNNRFGYNVYFSRSQTLVLITDSKEEMKKRSPHFIINKETEGQNDCRQNKDYLTPLWELKSSTAIWENMRSETIYSHTTYHLHQHDFVIPENLPRKVNASMFQLFISETFPKPS